jgi:hypothetical protein
LARLLAEMIASPRSFRWLLRDELRALRTADESQLAVLRATAGRPQDPSRLWATLMLAVVHDREARWLLADLLDTYHGSTVELVVELRQLHDAYADYADVVDPWLLRTLEVSDENLRQHVGWTCRLFRVRAAGTRLLELARTDPEYDAEFLEGAAACDLTPEVAAEVRRRLPTVNIDGRIRFDGALAEVVARGGPADRAWAVPAAAAELAANRIGNLYRMIAALVSAGPAGIAALTRLSTDAATRPWLRRHIAEGLARVPAGDRRLDLPEWAPEVADAVVAAGLASREAADELLAAREDEREELLTVRGIPSEGDVAVAILRLDRVVAGLSLEGGGSGFAEYDRLVEWLAEVTGGAVRVSQVRLVSVHTGPDGVERERDPVGDRDLGNETPMRLSFRKGIARHRVTVEVNANHGWYDLDCVDEIAAALVPVDPADPRRFVRLAGDYEVLVEYLFADPAALDRLEAATGICLVAAR